MKTLGIISAVCLCLASAVQADDEGMAFFESRIRPVLIKHCYECHSAAAGELKGSLSVENAASMKAGGDSGAIFVPGKPEDSLLIEALAYDGLEMPPSGKLPAEVVRDFRQWVAMGAPDPRTGDAARPKSHAAIDIEAGRKFWAFQPPVLAPLPPVADSAWPVTAIDRFILAKLEAAGLGPSPDIDKARLLRRLSYDLTGLPPREADLLSFQSDTDPQALTQAVDRLLASREYAEQWARHWLDVVRYADSNGGDFNATFHDAWRYRNYVIETYEQDRPIDRFIQEQLAGDLLPANLPGDAERQLIATGFLMLGPKMLSERDKLKLKLDVVDEQVDTIGKSLLGMTLGCARCHDHKFDPIPTTDYYALAGILHSSECMDGEIQKYVSDFVRRPLPIEPAHAEALQKYNAQKAKLDKQLKVAKKALDQAKSNAKKGAAGATDLSSIVVDDTQATRTGEWKQSVISKPYVGEGYIHDDNQEKGAKAIRFTPQIPTSGRYEVWVAYTPNPGRANNVPITIQHAMGTATATLNQQPAPTIDGQYQSIGEFPFTVGSAGYVELSNSGTEGHVIADAVAFVSKQSSLVPPPPPVAIALKDAPASPATLIKSHADQVQQIEDQLKELAKTAPPPAPQAMAIREAPQVEDCQVRVRGEPRQLGPMVPRGFLQVALYEEAPLIPPNLSGRLELAQWLTDPRNPLTARVYVNRVWQKLLGEGLVRTVDNFGELGERPTHPELLDRLTVEFVEHGWSTKWLVREIVLSRVYSQDSRERPAAFERDPDNRLLWRANRKRLSAEQLRDSLLAVSGQLQPSVADSPVAGLGQLVVDNNASSTAVAMKEPKVRTLYLPVIRNEVSTLLTVFDFADPDFVVGRRETTTVPAQALALLNHQFVIQNVAETTERMWREASPSDDQRMEWAAMHLWGHPASEGNRAEIRGYLERAASAANAKGDEKARWSEVIHAMYASTEFQFLD